MTDDITEQLLVAIKAAGLSYGDFDIDEGVAAYLQNELAARGLKIVDVRAAVEVLSDAVLVSMATTDCNLATGKTTKTFVECVDTSSISHECFDDSTVPLGLAARAGYEALEQVTAERDALKRQPALI